MRIGTYNQIQQVYGTTKPSKTNNVGKKSFSDAIEISSMGKDIHIAKQAVANASDVRSELTAPIKESIQSGTYSVSAQSFADKLLSKYEGGALDF